MELGSARLEPGPARIEVRWRRIEASTHPHEHHHLHESSSSLLNAIPIRRSSKPNHHRSPASAMGKVRAFFSRSGKRSSSSASSRTSAPPSPSPSTRLPAAAAAALSGDDELERVFRKFDANGDGRISRSELAALFAGVGRAATDEEVTRMMEEADADGDGYVSLPEFAAVVDSAPAGGDAEEDLRHAFGVFDADGDGLITPAELARVLRGIGEAATVAQCKRMIRGVDRNGDGLVSFDEFKIMMAGGGGGGFGFGGAIGA